MDDIIIQFARLWGNAEVIITSVDTLFAEELKSWDSEEMFNLLKKWVREFNCNGWNDTVEFFEYKRQMYDKIGALD